MTRGEKVMLVQILALTVAAVILIVFFLLFVV